MTRLLTRIEAADYLRLSVPQLDNLARRGEVQRVKIGVGPRARVLYREQDLDAFIEANIDPPTAEEDAATESLA